MRWLYHVTTDPPEAGAPLAPASLATEGFVHASYAPRVTETAALYFSASKPVVLRIDPRRVAARVEEADTPRGPMPHVYGPIPADAIREVLSLADVEAAPDRVTGTRVAFVAFAGMTLLDLVAMLDPLSRIRSMGFDATFAYDVVSADAPVVFEGGGATLAVTAVRPPLDGYDLIAVAGGIPSRALSSDPAALAWLRTFPENRIAASVCTGALLLGAAGRLSGKRATTHASALGALEAYGATPVSERVVDEGTLVTAGGVTSGIDLGLHLVARLEGPDVARAIAKQMAVRGGPFGTPA